MILSDVTTRKMVVDNKQDVIHIVERSIDDNLININRKGKVYEIDLVYKVGDYFKK